MSVVDEVATLLERVAKLEAALRWYAEPVSYAITQAREPRSAVHEDGGRRARAALADAEAAAEVTEAEARAAWETQQTKGMTVALTAFLAARRERRS